MAALKAMEIRGRVPEPEVELLRLSRMLCIMRRVVG